MNSVHEPGPNGDSETIPSRKTRSKTKPGARAPKLAQLGTPRCAQARPGARAHAVSWPAQCRIVVGLPSCTTPQAAVSRRPSAISQTQCRSPLRAVQRAPCQLPCAPSCAHLNVSPHANDCIVGVCAQCRGH